MPKTVTNTGGYVKAITVILYNPNLFPCSGVLDDRNKRTKDYHHTRLKLGCPLVRNEFPMIYFIQEELHGLIKIGFTAANAFERMRALQTSSPAALHLLTTIPGDLTTEAKLHDQFASLH